MLSLSSILVHRLQERSSVIQRQIEDFSEGREVEEEEGDGCIDSRGQTTLRFSYSDHCLPLYKLCNQYDLVLATGLTEENVENRKQLSGVNDPVQPLPPPKCDAFRDSNFPPPVLSSSSESNGPPSVLRCSSDLISKDAAWWRDIQSLLRSRVTVYRSQRLSTILATELVTGDIVFISGGNQVHADVRVLVADQCVAESYLGFSPRRFTVQEKPNHYDPLQCNNLLPCGSVLLEGNLYGVVVRTGKKTLQALIGTQLSPERKEEELKLEKSVTFNKKKAKQAFQMICENCIIPQRLTSLSSLLYTEVVVVAIPSVNARDLRYTAQQCADMNMRLLIINHNSAVLDPSAADPQKDDNLLTSLIPFHDDLAFTQKGIQSFLSEWCRRTTPVEGILLLPDLCVNVIQCLREMLPKDRNQVAFVGGSYVHHIRAFEASTCSISFLSGVELARSKSDALLLSDEISHLFKSKSLLKEIGPLTISCTIA